MKYKVKSTNDTIRFNWKSILLFITGVFYPHGQMLFFSEKFGFFFSRPSGYWIEVGKRNALIELIAKQKKLGIKGVSFDEILQRMGGLEFGSGTGVILFNINTYALGRTLDRFEGINASIFREDFVFIPTDSREHARRIMSKLTPVLAETIAIDNGLIFDRNTEEKENL